MHIIFDFDGTLINSFQRVIDEFNILAQENQFRHIESHEIAALKEMTSGELVSFLQIPFYKIPGVLYQVRKRMHQDINKLESFANLPQVIQQLFKADCKLGILTSNTEENVSAWLDTMKLQHMFNFIYAETAYTGKKSLLKKIIKNHKINKSHAYYIGDETRDIDAANENDIFSVAVTWGYHSEKALLKHAPDHVAREPDDLLKILPI